MMPSVTAIAACCGLRPVAKAFGVSVGIRYTRGIGMPARVASRRTIGIEPGAWASSIGLARYMASTILSENQ